MIAIDNTYPIHPIPPPKKVITVMNAGAHRGARENLAGFVAFNSTSERAVIQPVYLDPVPGRALALQEEAARHGIVARAVEGRVEDVTEHGGGTNDPLVLNVDRASAIASALRAPENATRPMLGYLLLKLPSGRLWAVRFVFEASDVALRDTALKFFEKLAEVSERNGADAILGDGADPSHILLEPKIRSWFASHTAANLTKVAAGIEPVSSAVEVTTDGDETRALHIVERADWSEPGELAAQVADNPSMPIRRGAAFVVAEVTPLGIRFHLARRRTDDQVSVSGGDTVDRAALARAPQPARSSVVVSAPGNSESAETGNLVGALLAGFVLAALTSGRSETVSRRNPILTTD